MAFNFDNLAQFPALNRFFSREKTGIKTPILIRRDGQSFASRQVEQHFCLRQRRRERFLNQHIFTRFQRAFSVFEMAVSMGTDDHQLYLRIAQHLIQIAGEVNMRILRRLLFRFSVTTENMRDMPGIFPIQNVGEMVTGGTFAKSNKCAV